MRFDTQIEGIPCQCRVTDYQKGSPALILPHGGGHPPEPEEFEFELYDRKGYRAKWLEKKVNDKIKCRLLAEYIELADAEQYA